MRNEKTLARNSRLFKTTASLVLITFSTLQIAWAEGPSPVATENPWTGAYALEKKIPPEPDSPEGGPPEEERSTSNEFLSDHSPLSRPTPDEELIPDKDPPQLELLSLRQTQDKDYLLRYEVRDNQDSVRVVQRLIRLKEGKNLIRIEESDEAGNQLTWNSVIRLGDKSADTEGDRSEGDEWDAETSLDERGEGAVSRAAERKEPATKRYHANGRLYIWNQVTFRGSVKTKRVYKEYDKSGNLTRLLTQTFHKNGNLRISEDLRYANKKKTYRYYRAHESDGDPIRVLNETYQSNGRLSNSNDIRYEKGKQVKRLYKTFDENGRERTRSEYRYEKEVLHELHDETFLETGERTRYLKKTFYSNPSPSLKSVEDYRYERGRLVRSEVSEYLSNGALKESRTLDYQNPIVTNQERYLLRYTVDGNSYEEEFELEEGTNQIEREHTGFGGTRVLVQFRMIRDRTAPTGTIAIGEHQRDDQGRYVTSREVTLSLSASDEASGIDQMRFSIDGGETWSEWEKVPGTFSKALTLPEGDGQKEVRMELKDKAGNISDQLISDSVTLDLDPPSGSVLINDGDPYTNSRTVTLTLTSSDAGSGVQEVRYKVGERTWSDWEKVPGTFSKALTLDDADGLQIVSYEVKDKTGKVSSFNDSISLDRSKPTGSAVVNGGARHTNSFKLSLTLTAFDELSGVVDMRFSNNFGFQWSDWEPFGTTKDWTLSPSDGKRWVAIEVRDRAKNSWQFYGGIIVDIAAPLGSIVINNDSDITVSQDVTLSLSAEDAPFLTGSPWDVPSGIGQMRFSSDDRTTWTNWEDFAAAKELTLPLGDGPKTVIFELKDRAGNSVQIQDTVILDLEKPTGSIQINTGDDYTNSQTVTLALTQSDEGSGVQEVRYKAGEGNWTDWEAPVSAKELTLADPDGPQTVYYEIKDKTGKVSETYSDTIILDTQAPEITGIQTPERTQESQIKIYYKVDGQDQEKTLLLEEGTNQIQITEKDEAGNETTVIVSIIRDTEAPVLTLLSKNPTNQTVYTLRYEMDDKIDGKTEKTKSLNLQEGENTVQVTERDRTGNEVTKNFTITLDTQVPEITISKTPGSLTNASEILIEYTVDGEEKTKTLRRSDGTLHEGENIVTLEETDVAGNTTQKKITFTTDWTKPEIKTTSKFITNQLAYTLQYEVTDNHDAAQSKEKFFTLEREDGTSPDGDYEVFVTEADEAGNEQTQSFIIVLDTVPPEITDLQYKEETDKTEETIRYKVDGVITERNVALSDGENSIDITETDEAGNENSVTVKIVYSKPRLEDGTELFYQDGNLVRERTSNGDEIYYGPNGETKSFRFSDGYEIQYEKESPNRILILDPEGEIKEIIDRPTVLQLDETKTIRVSVDGGLDAYYEGGELVEIRTKEGVRLTALTLNSNNEIQDALVVYSDGTQEVFRRGNLIRKIKPDGSILDFLPLGFPVREILKDHIQFFQFDKLSQTKIKGVSLFSPNKGIVTYDEAGVLKEAANIDGTRFIYKRSGTQENGYKIQLDRPDSSTARPDTLVEASYGELGLPTEMIFEDGKRVLFNEDGHPLKTILQDGTETDFELSNDQSGGMNLAVERNNARMVYGKDGLLKNLTTPDETVFNIDNDLKKITAFTLVDGRIVSDYQVGENRELTQATITEPSGRVLYYSNGKIEKTVDPDGTIREFENEKLKKMITADGGTYLFETTVDGAGEEILKGSLISVVLESGIEADFSGNTVEQLTLNDGSQVRDFEYDAQGKFKKGSLYRPDNSILAFEGTALKQLKDAQGTTYFYTDGLLERVLFADGKDFAIRYLRDPEGQPLYWSYQEGSVSRFYDFSGRLSHLETGEFRSFYNGGNLTELATPSLSLTQPQISKNDELEGGVITTTDQFKVYFEDGKLASVETPFGIKLEYEKGLLQFIDSPLRGKTEIVPIFDSSGTLTGANVRYAADDGNNEEKPILDFITTTDHFEEVLILLESSWEETLDLENRLEDIRNDVYGEENIQKAADNRSELVKELTTTWISQERWTEFQSRLWGMNGTTWTVRFTSDESDKKWMHIDYSGVTCNPYCSPRQYNTFSFPYESQATPDLETALQKEGEWSNSIPLIWRQSSNVPLPNEDMPFTGSFSLNESTWKEGYQKVKEAYIKNSDLITEPQKVSNNLIQAVIFPVSQEVFLELSQTPIEIRLDAVADKVVSTNSIGEEKLYQDGKLLSFRSSGEDFFTFNYEAGRPDAPTSISMLSQEGKQANAEIRYGQLRKLSDPEGEVQYRYEFDREGGEITVMTDSETGEIRRFRGGKLLSVEDVRGLVTEYAYDDNTLTGSRLRYKNKILEELRYEPDGEFLKAIDNEGVVRWYNDNGDLVRYRTPDGIEYGSIWAEDSEGNPIRLIQISRRILEDGSVYEYSEGKVRKIISPKGEVVAKDLDYSSAGILTNGTFVGQASEEIIFKEFLEGPDQQTPRSKIHLSSFEEVEIEYDSDGRPEFFVVRDGDKTFRYNKSGELILFDDPSNHRSYLYRYTRDSLGKIQQVTVTEATRLVVGGREVPGNWAVGRTEAELQIFKDGILYDKNPADSTSGIKVFVIDDATGNVETDELFRWSWIRPEEPPDGKALINLLEELPEGKWLFIVGLPARKQTMRFQLFRGDPSDTEAFLNLLQDKFGAGDMGDTVGGWIRKRGPVVFLGWSGAPQGSAVEVGHFGQTWFDSTRTRTAYFDIEGNSLSSVRLAIDPIYLRLGQVYDGNVFPTEVTEVFQLINSVPIEPLEKSDPGMQAVTHPLATQWFKNYNPLYPDSGFYRFWPGYESEDLASFSDSKMEQYFGGFLQLTDKFKEKAVYFDDDYPTSKLSIEDARRIKDFLKSQGFAVVNADELKEWITNKSKDSIVFMAQDVIPVTVVGGADPVPLPRDYLDKGGSILWLYDNPFFFKGYPGNQKLEWSFESIEGQINPMPAQGFSDILGISQWYGGATVGCYANQSVCKAPIYYPDGTPAVGPSTTWFGYTGDSYDSMNMVTVPIRRLTLDEMAWGRNIEEESYGLESERVFQKPLELTQRFPEVYQWTSLIDDLRQNALDTETIIWSKFNKEGELLSDGLAGGNFRVYEEGRIRHVYNKAGEPLLQYDYDNQGNPLRITLLDSRNKLGEQEKHAGLEISVRKAAALEKLAYEEQVARNKIQTTFQQGIALLQQQRSQLEKQLEIYTCTPYSWSGCIKTKDPVVAAGIQAINDEIQNLSEQQAQTLADLDEEVQKLKDEIDQQEEAALAKLAEEILKLRREIIKAESTPVVLHYYRLILGRDPGTEETQTLVEEALSNGGAVDTQALTSNLSSLSEKQERKQQVAEIIGKAKDFFTEYFQTDMSRKQALQSSLGLQPQDVVSLSNEEWSAILAWLESRDLHFGNSAFLALLEMLKAEGKNISLADLASQVILIDILTGVIHKFTEGELELSLFGLQKAAEIYNINFYPAQLTWEELSQLYLQHRAQFPDKSFRMIAHVDQNHYVVVTKVDRNQVTYLELNKGPAGESITILREEFLSTWSGYVLAPILPESPDSLLSVSDAQKVKGSFFEFLLPLIVGIILALKVAVIAAIQLIIYAVQAAIFVIKASIAAVVKGITLLSKGLFNIGKFLFQGVRFAAKSLLKGFDFLRQGVLKGFDLIKEGITKGFNLIKEGLKFSKDFLFTPHGKEVLMGGKIVKTFTLSQTIARNMVAFGVGFTSGKALESMGVSPTFSRIFSAFLSGGILGISTLATQGVLGGFINGSLSALALQGVSEIGRHLDLPPPLTNALSIVTGAVIGAALDPSITVPQALKNIAPTVARELAQYGLTTLGSKLGLDPRVTALIGVPIRIAVGKLFPQSPGSIKIPSICGPENPEACIPRDPDTAGQSLWSLFFKWIAGKVIQRISGFLDNSSDQNNTGTPGGDPEDPLPNDDQKKKISEISSESRQLQNIDISPTQSVEHQLEQKYEINGTLAEARQIATKLISGQSDISAMPRYGQYVQQNGIAAALDNHATSFFDRSALEKMVSNSPDGTVKGFVNNQIANGGLTDVVDGSGRSLKRLTLTRDLVVEYDPATMDIVNVRDGNFGISYQDIRYNANLNRPELFEGDIIRLNPANNVRIDTSVANGRITQVTFSDAQGELARIVPADGKSFITTRDNLFFDYKLQEFRPPAEFNVEGGFIKDVRYTITQDLDINGNNISIDILLEKVNDGNPVLKAIAHNLELLNLQGSELDTVLRVIADHFEKKLKNDGKIWIDENGQIRLNGLSDVFDFSLDKVTQDDIIRQLEIPDRILNSQNDLLHFSEQLIVDAEDFETAKGTIVRIRSDLENPAIPAIIETGHLEVTGITPDGSKVLKTSVSSGVIFRGEGAHLVPGTTDKTAQAEIFVDKSGTVYYTDTALNQERTFYPRKDYLTPGADRLHPNPVSGKDTLADASVFEINTTKRTVLQDGQVATQPEKIRIEVGRVQGKNEMFVLVRKESGNYYSEALTKITLAKPNSGIEEVERVLKTKNVLEVLLESFVNTGKAVGDLIQTTLKSILI